MPIFAAEDVLDDLIGQYMPREQAPHEWDLAGFKEELRKVFDKVKVDEHADEVLQAFD